MEEHGESTSPTSLHSRHKHSTPTRRNQSPPIITSPETPSIQLLTKKQLSTHPLHHLTVNTSRPRKMKDTIFNNYEYHTTTPAMTNTFNITNKTIQQNIKANHTK